MHKVGMFALLGCYAASIGS